MRESSSPAPWFRWISSSLASLVSPLALLALEVVLGEVEIWVVGGKFSVTCWHDSVPRRTPSFPLGATPVFGSDLSLSCTGLSISASSTTGFREEERWEVLGLGPACSPAVDAVSYKIGSKFELMENIDCSKFGNKERYYNDYLITVRERIGAFRSFGRNIFDRFKIRSFLVRIRRGTNCRFAFVRFLNPLGLGFRWLISLFAGDFGCINVVKIIIIYIYFLFLKKNLYLFSHISF